MLAEALWQWRRGGGGGLVGGDPAWREGLSFFRGSQGDALFFLGEEPDRVRVALLCVDPPTPVSQVD